MQVHVYIGFSSGYVVEGNRLHGDPCIFRSLYAQLKMDLSTEEGDSGVCYDSFTVFTPLPMPPSLLAESSDLHGLGPIFRMAQSPYVEAQLEAVKNLCDLSNEDSIRAQMGALGCISVLMELLRSSPSEWVQQLALLTLANLSDCMECHNRIIECGIPAMLLGLCCDGNYKTAEVRVLAAYILSNICGQEAALVAGVIGSQELEAWLPTVDALTDDRVRLHCERARDCLAQCVCV
jgi:hypothetical protein